MASNKDSFGRTLIFVFAVCFVCSILVAGAAVGLKPLQKANALLDKQTKILEASGLLDKAGSDIPATYEKYVSAKLINLDSGDFVDGDAIAFNERMESRNAAQSIKLTSEQDGAGISRRANHSVAYIVKDDSGQVNTIVLPIHGSGLWDLMFGFVGLEPDLNTVRSVIYSDHKETPGLGALVTSDKWKSLWPGKKLFDENNQPVISIIKGGAKPGDIHGVDAVSGATLTSDGVQNTLRFWFGEQGYGPFIAKHRNGGIN